MTRTGILLLVFVCTTLPCGTCPVCRASDEDEIRAAIKGWWNGGYKIDPLLRTAEVLQKMGKDEACRRLLTLIEEKEGDGVPVRELCRLVFKAKKGSDFRRPRGGHGFLGGSSYDDWPLDPLAVVDGVPFVVTESLLFNNAGTWAESEKDYLKYCMKECDWNDAKFAPKSKAEKEKALEKLLSSKKWKEPLTDEQRERLRAQIRAPEDDEIKAAIKGWSWEDDYKVEPFLRAAEVLQKMGKDEACLRLRTLCTDKDGVPVGWLCRLVFKAKKDSEFRRQGIGEVGFLGATRSVDWPLDPFAVIDGVPFLVTEGGYLITVAPESDEDYLEYCMKECDWNDVRFVTKTKAEKEKALERLLSSKKWKEPLTDKEQDHLRAQIK
jgi:hypothetical protein